MPASCSADGRSPKHRMPTASETISPSLAKAAESVAPFTRMLLCMETSPATKTAPPTMPSRRVSGLPLTTRRLSGKKAKDSAIQVR